MQGDALSWFKWLQNNNLLIDWQSFTRALELRFGPSTYINHQVELFKLQQTSTVTEYQGRFEHLYYCVVGLTPETILNCFISGLSIDIRRELTILNPYSIAQDIGLAKLIEDKLRDSKPKQHVLPHHHTTPPLLLHSQTLDLIPLPYPTIRSNTHKTSLIFPNARTTCPRSMLQL